MKLQEVLRRINFKIGTSDDITGKSINPFIENKYIIDELNSQMRQYANTTKGIMDIYPLSINRGDYFVEAPPLALRSESYYYIYIISKGTIFSVDIRSPQDTYPVFRVTPIVGIPNWIMPVNKNSKQYLNIFPQNSLDCITTTLTKDIKADDTTIPVTSTNGYIKNNGYFNIGEEKICYTSVDSTNFYGCLRGYNNTKAVNHKTGESVIENNLVIQYSRLHIPIIIPQNNNISPEILNMDMDVVEEHMEGIIKATAYNLLVKIAPDRAAVYKEDFMMLYDQYAKDIKKGYFRGRNGTNVRDPYYINESGYPFAPVGGY